MREMRSKNNIVLVGFMGVGKSVVARLISKQAKYYALDTDAMIESSENRKIKNIFEKHSEFYFRNLEKKCAKFLQHSVNNAVIATGGGFYKVDNINKIGKVFYIKMDFDKIITRLKSLKKSKENFTKRPLLYDLNKAKKLYSQRVKDYENIADFVIEAEGKKPYEIANEIIQLAKERN